MASVLFGFDTQIVLTTVSCLSASLVLWASICTINYMTATTPLPNRVAHILLGVGAAAMLLGPLYFDNKPTPGGAILTTGVALLLVTERLYTRKLRHRYCKKLGLPRRPWWG